MLIFLDFPTGFLDLSFVLKEIEKNGTTMIDSPGVFSPDTCEMYQGMCGNRLLYRI